MGSLYSEADLLRRPVPKPSKNANEKDNTISSSVKVKEFQSDSKNDVLSLNSKNKQSIKTERKQHIERSLVSINPLEEPVVTAEGVALSLLKSFPDKQLPRASDIDWLVSEKDAPQQVLITQCAFPLLGGQPVVGTP